MNIWRQIGLGVIGRVRHGSIEFVEGDRSTIVGDTDSDLSCTITIHSPKAWRQVLRGSTGLAMSYAAGLWDCDDLVTMSEIGGRNVYRFDKVKARFAWFLKPSQRLFRMRPNNSKRRSRKQIAAHYDLGNDLYEIFLDRSMNYSSAKFTEPDESLEDAQVTKMDQICDQLELGPDDHLLEIGTGWGGLAVHLAQRSGCRITTTTISKEQAILARERIANAGLSDSIEVLEVDYRDLTGTYDKLVSIEMIEAVGWRYFPTYFEQCSKLLKPDGAMLLQAITIIDEAYENEKTSRNFTNSIIFPGGCLPSVAEIKRCLASFTDMKTVWMDEIGADYAETLKEWRMRFLAAEEKVKSFGYDLNFRRMWELYLAWAEGGFRARRISDFQMLLAKPGFVPGATKNAAASLESSSVAS